MDRRIVKVALVGMLAVMALGAVACGGPVSAAPPAQGGTAVPSSNTPTSDIGVSGTGRVFADPDTAIATVGVEMTSATLAAASSDVSTRMTAVINKIKSMGVDPKDIKTTSYSVNPITSPQKDTEVPRITGYHVSNVVQIKIRKLDQVGPIMDAALGAGANSMNGLYYTIDDPTPQMQQARTKAVQDAMAKAKTLADAAGVKLGAVTSITENVQGPQPLYDRAMLAAPSAAAGGGIGPVQSGQNEVDVTVEMHWAIAQ